MNGIHMEELTEEHLKDVLDIYNYYVLNSTATWHYHTLTEEEMRQIVFSEDDRYKSFVIRENGSLCGYVLIHQYKTREAYGDTAEMTIYLKDESRGKGIGPAAIRYIEAFAKEKGIHVLISSISGDNTASIRLFEKCGYEKCAHFREVGKKFGKLLDNVVYQKILD